VQLAATSAAERTTTAISFVVGSPLPRECFPLLPHRIDRPPRPPGHLLIEQAPKQRHLVLRQHVARLKDAPVGVGPA
jgi:hypothetical protein